MVQDTKLTFSKEELAVMQNSRFFEVKHEVNQKITNLLAELEKELVVKARAIPNFTDERLALSGKGKIFKGENYRMMPYLILDYPRLFSTDSVFAFRSMFRWGHEFSFTLHLQGDALEIFRNQLQRNISTLFKHDFFVCVNDTPWEYSFNAENYLPLDIFHEAKTNELEEMIRTKTFLKFSRKLELEHYDRAVLYGAESFSKLIHLLQG